MAIWFITLPRRVIARYPQLIVLSCFFALVTSCATHVIPTKIYYKDIKRYQRYCIVSDWHDVLVKQKNPMSKGCAALGVLPFNIIANTFCKNFKSIMRACGKRGLRDAQGNLVIGTGACIRFLAIKEPRLMKYYKKLLHVMAHTKPIDSTIDWYIYLHNTFGYPIVVWTNTDLDLFQMQYKHCNYMRALGNKVPLILHGYFGVGQHTSNIPICQYTLSKKPHQYFYISALAYAKQVVDDVDDLWAYIYIDDKSSHINIVRTYARELNLPIMAIHYTETQQLQEDMRFICGI